MERPRGRRPPAVLVIFLALQSYQRARPNSAVEAVAITEFHGIAEFFPGSSRRLLQGDLVCYARAVIADGWPAMKDGHDRRPGAAMGRSAPP